MVAALTGKAPVLRELVADLHARLQDQSDEAVHLAVREFVRSKRPGYSLNEHLDWLEQQVHFELRWHQHQQRFRQLRLR